jgi:hypothetical protein
MLLEENSDFAQHSVDDLMSVQLSLGISEGLVPEQYSWVPKSATVQSLIENSIVFACKLSTSSHLR